jgi:hypothetical protein
MISDVLLEAVNKIDEYLKDPTFVAVYPSDSHLTMRIVALRNEADGIRATLDRPPAAPVPAEEETPHDKQFEALLDLLMKQEEVYPPFMQMCAAAHLAVDMDCEKGHTTPANIPA